MSEIQINVYWHELLQKWVAEVRNLAEHDLCIFFTESLEYDTVVARVCEFLLTNRKKRTQCTWHTNQF